MTCLDDGAISRVASGEDDPHATGCASCRVRVERERELRARLRALPVPAMSLARRTELRAELLGAAALRPPGKLRASRPATIAAAGFGVAAALAAMILHQDRARLDELPPLASAVELPALPAPSLERASTSIVIEQTPLAHEPLPAAERIAVPRRATASSRVVIATDRGAPVQPPIERDTLPLDTSARDAMQAFRAGWVALRGGRHAEAIAQFARVTDPVAREEAMFWAAVAARRTGDTALAAEHLARFRSAFPRSSYLAQFE